MGGSVNGAARINKHPAAEFFGWFRLQGFCHVFSWAFIICVLFLSLRLLRFGYLFKTQIFRMSWEHHLKVSGCFYYFFHGWLGCAVPWRSHPNPSTHGLMPSLWKRFFSVNSAKPFQNSRSASSQTRKNSHLVTIWVLVTRVEYTISLFKLHLRSKAIVVHDHF